MRLNIIRKDGPSIGGSSFTGGTLTSPLILAGDPTHPLGAATKQYVDSSLAALGTGGPISGTIPVASLPAFTGDVSSSAGTNTLTLSNTGVAAGTYAKVTVDAKGRVTAGGALAASDIPNLHWSKITAGKPTTLSGYGITDGVNKSGDTMTGPLTLSGNATSPLHAVPLQQVNEVTSSKVNKSGDSMTGPLLLAANPTQPLEAATKQYVDNSLAASSNDGVEFIARGNIPNAGLAVGLNVDGTVSVIAEDGPPESWGRVTDYSGGVAVYNSANQRVVVVYSAGNHIYATVGTISGNNISFGGQVTVASFSNYYIYTVRLQCTSAIYNSTDGRVILLYSVSYDYPGDEYSSGGTESNLCVRVGTVSGNSISFGGEVIIVPTVQLHNLYTRYIYPGYDPTNQKVIVVLRLQQSHGGNYLNRVIVGTASSAGVSFGGQIGFGNNLPTSIVHDSFNNRIVIAYTDYSDGSHHGKVIIGTVSGNSISFGSAVTFNAAPTPYASAVYDSANKKVVIAYRANNGHGVAVVGTVSGNSMSFGTPVVFNGDFTDHISAVYDSASQKVVIAYRRNNRDGYGAVITGTVSGNSISFGAPVVFHSWSVNSISASYISANKVAIFYKSSDRGNVCVIYSPSSLAINKNTFIGISQNSATNGATVRVKTKGQIDSNQSGLTPGQLYYVSGTGTLTTISDGGPSVGKAISPTKLLITN